MARTFEPYPGKLSPVYAPETDPPDVEVGDWLPGTHRLPPDLVPGEYVDWRDVNYLGERLAELAQEIADLQATNLPDLDDVDDALDATEGNVLTYRGGQWVSLPNGMVVPAGNATERWRMKLADTYPSWTRGDWVNLLDCGDVDGNGQWTAAFAEALNRSDANKVPVFIPPNPSPYLTDTMNYRMQSFLGVDCDQCQIQGLPGKDVFNVDPSLGQFYRQNGDFAHLTIIVDDSVDAAASFPDRGGVGNAGYALDYPDKNLAARPSAVNWHHHHLYFRSLSQVVGGKNNSCAIYTQNNHFTQNLMTDIVISYCKYGWKDHYPVRNFTPYLTSMSRDHPHVHFLHFLRNGYQFTPYGWGIGVVSNIMFHGGPSIVDLDSDWNYMKVHAVEMVGNAPSLNWLQSSRSYKNTYSAFTWSCNALLIWNEDESRYHGNFNRQPVALPAAQINGNLNQFALTQVDPTQANYGFDYIDDRGIGNRFEGGRTPSNSVPHRVQAMTPQGNRLSRDRDSISGMLGIVDGMFVSSDDLLVNPRDLRLNAGLGTTFDYIYDPTIEPFRVCFRRIGAGTQTTFDTNNLNGIDGFKVGWFLPPTKIRVYVRQRSDVAGTLTWTLQAPVGTTKGTSGAQPIDTTWRSIAFDADLTGVAAGTAIRLTSSTLGAGATSLDIACIMFRPWAQDMPVAGAVTSGAVVSKSGAYTVTNQDDLITVDATAGAVTISLTAGSKTTRGQVFTVKKIDSSANAVTIARVTDGTIDGVNSILLRDQWDSVTLRADGANFNIVSRVDAPVRATATLDFPSIAANACAELTINCIGAAAGDGVVVAPPSALEVGLLFSALVSATNTVRIRVCNQTAAAIDPASANWTVMVHKLAVG